MKFLTLFLILAFGALSAQDACHLAAPDSIRTVPDYRTILKGSFVTFTAYGGTRDSSCWFSLYGEECCVERLDSNRTGVFARTVWASDIFYVRVESACDTTWGASIDIDAYEETTDIEKTTSRGVFTTGDDCDMLGRPIRDEPQGLFVRKRRLFFR